MGFTEFLVGWPFDSLGSQHRFSFLWSNPNHAGAVIASLTPFVWSTRLLVHSNNRISIGILFWAVELCLVSMLALTRSRGAVLAVVIALLMFAFAYRELGIFATFSQRIKFVGVRLVLFLSLMTMSGVTGRFIAISERDPSVFNRFPLWLGGLQLIDARPLTGWGRGYSGFSFMQWIQDYDVHHTYGGMVNTYLHISVEYGLVALAGSLTTVLLLILLLSRSEIDCLYKNNLWVRGSICSFCAFAVAAFFSTLWMHASVAILPIAAFLFACYQAIRMNRLIICLRLLGISIGTALLITCVVGYLAWCINRDSAWHISVLEDGGVELRRRGAEHGGGRVVVLPDILTFGRFYGKEVRRIGDSLPSLGRLLVYPLERSPLSILPSDLVIVSGPRVDELVRCHPTAMLLIFPRGEIPAAGIPKSGTSVLLPAYTDLDVGRSWVQWITQVGIPASVVPMSHDRIPAPARLIPYIKRYIELRN